MSVEMKPSISNVGADVPDISALKRKDRAKPGQLALAVVSVLFILFVVVAFARGDIDWGTVGKYLAHPSILEGLVNTIVMTFIAMAIGLALGVVFAVMRIVPNVVLNKISIAYIWLFRGIPQLLQLLLWYNMALIFPTVGIPGVFEAQTITFMTPFVATILGLGLCQGAYTSEVVRAGILSVDKGQIEAGQAIGMTGRRVMMRITLPQALRVIVPPVGNEFISMVKLTSLASAIQFSEILHNAQDIYFVSGQVMELLFVATFWYLIIVTVFSIIQHFIESRLSRGYSSTRPAKSSTAATKREESK
jgi:polar amino acid transport system permease protein